MNKTALFVKKCSFLLQKTRCIITKRIVIVALHNSIKLDIKAFL